MQPSSFRVRRDHTVLLFICVVFNFGVGVGGANRAPGYIVVLVPALVALMFEWAVYFCVVNFPTAATGAELVTKRAGRRV